MVSATSGTAHELQAHSKPLYDWQRRARGLLRRRKGEKGRERRGLRSNGFHRMRRKKLRLAPKFKIWSRLIRDRHLVSGLVREALRRQKSNAAYPQAAQLPSTSFSKPPPQCPQTAPSRHSLLSLSGGVLDLCCWLAAGLALPTSFRVSKSYAIYRLSGIIRFLRGLRGYALSTDYSSEPPAPSLSRSSQSMIDYTILSFTFTDSRDLVQQRAMAW